MAYKGDMMRNLQIELRDLKGTECGDRPYFVHTHTHTHTHTLSFAKQVGTADKRTFAF